MHYSLTEAADATGKHKSTILRALQAGKIPSAKDVHGNYQIEADELFKVYPAIVRNDGDAPANAIEPTSATVRNEATDAQPDAISAQLDAVQQVSEQKSSQISDLQSTVADLQKRLDQAEADRRLLESDRREASSGAARQIEQLTGVMALKERTLQDQARALEHLTVEQTKPEIDEQPVPVKSRGWLAKLIG